VRPFPPCWYLTTAVNSETEAQREIQQQALDELNDAHVDNISLSFYFTSIYDHSIFEAFSKVVQKLIPQLPTLENLLDVLISVRQFALVYFYVNCYA
jgi:Ras-related GTP-binding protein C/D